MHASAFIACSLDGFIARRDGGLDWLPQPKPGAEDYGYAAFMRGIDAIVMGRRTYQTVLRFGQWPYGKTPVVVLTSSTAPIELPSDPAADVQTLRGSPDGVALRLAQKGWKNLYVDGGATITGFLQAGALDRLIVTRVPVLLGEGVPLFGALPKDVALEHVRTTSWPDGLVQSEYRVLR